MASKNNRQYNQRFCLRCCKITQFTYNKNIFHSECSECGSRKSINPRNTIIVNAFYKCEELEKINQEYCKLIKELLAFCQAANAKSLLSKGKVKKYVNIRIRYEKLKGKLIKHFPDLYNPSSEEPASPFRQA